MYNSIHSNTNKNFTREDLKKKKKEVADLQANIEELQIEYYQLKEDLSEKMLQNIQVKHSKEQIDINKTKNLKLGITDKNAVKIY